VLGLGGAWLFWNAAGEALQQFLPNFKVAQSTIIVGSAVALGVALVSGFVPAYRAYRLSVVQALRTIE
jgi:ABC-type antimicrobial peptide transport system permease subunit